MSVAQAPLPDRGTSPLMSNNPFRNRIASSSPRPVSTNPFLDNTEFQPANTGKAASPDSTTAATQIFASLDIEDKSEPQSSPNRRLRPGSPRRPENGASRSMRGAPPPGHRPRPSDEERRRQPAMLRRPTDSDVFADPPLAQTQSRSRPERLPRRNSESSIMDKASPLDPDAERLRRERKYREAKQTASTKTKPSRKLDIIDKLDVTSIYGTGLFHHDGPFDACNPHRNRRRHKLAPMQAFPKDSENMRLGGSGPVRSKLDYNAYHGYGQEAHNDFSEARADESIPYYGRPATQRHQSFNATARVDPVHGEETAGLGTSTFLEGAPASRAAMQRRDSEFDQNGQTNGLSRKKSLAQKIRAVRPGGRITSPEVERPPTSPPITGQSESGVNPFFKDYDQEQEKKGPQIVFAEEQVKPSRARAASSPKGAQTLERSLTGGSSDAAVATPPAQSDSKPMGLLGRMKSLKKPRARSEKRDAS